MDKGIVYISQNELTPRVEGVFQSAEMGLKKKQILACFKARKEALCDRNYVKSLGRRGLTGFASEMQFEEIYKIVWGVADKLGKEPGDLSEHELISYYDGNDLDLFGGKNLTAIFSRYNQRVRENEIAEWLSEVKGKKKEFVRDADLESAFGRAPWLVFNEILDAIFKGKINVATPDEHGLDVEFRAVFVLASTQETIEPEDLSSGEKTLLWLALVSFCTQCSSVGMGEPPKILLLDEPDAFLHPSMVVQMMDFLKAFNRLFSTVVIITTHSPTTVALSPKDSVHLLSDGVIKLLERDVAIGFLLEGVSQISVNPDNRRQVYVESLSDADIYQSIYGRLTHDQIDQKVSLSFVSSGPSMPKNQIKEKFAKVFGKEFESEKLDEFLKLVNGVGSCELVRGAVEKLYDEGNKTVRGLIDWDMKNTTAGSVVVLGEGIAYSIENLVLDPVCVMLKLHVADSKKHRTEDFCKSQIKISDWLGDQELMQFSVDRFLSLVLEGGSKKDAEIKYISGVVLKTDVRYLTMNGHDLAALLLEKFDVLKKATRCNPGKLPGIIVEEVMLTIAECKLIPVAFPLAFSLLQKET